MDRPRQGHGAVPDIDADLPDCPHGLGSRFRSSDGDAKSLLKRKVAWARMSRCRAGPERWGGRGTVGCQCRVLDRRMRGKDRGTPRGKSRSTYRDGAGARHNPCKTVGTSAHTTLRDEWNTVARDLEFHPIALSPLRQPRTAGCGDRKS